MKVAPDRSLRMQASGTLMPRFICLCQTLDTGARSDRCPSNQRRPAKAVTAQRLPMYATLLGCDAVTPSAQ